MCFLKKDKNNKNDKYEHLDLCNAACATECTGLIQVWPLTEDEAEAYNHVYNYMPPDIRTNKDQS